MDYPDNARRFAFFALAAVTALPRLVPGPVVLHAHDWHTALALVYLRTSAERAVLQRRLPRSFRSTTPAIRDTSRPR